MSDIGQTERATQNRVITVFRDELGYDYLGNWQDRPNNSNIEDSLLTNYLTTQGYNPAQIVKTLYELRSTADNPNRNLYDNNQAVYSLIHYGVQVKTSAGENTETVQLIDWQNPESNHFSIAQEVTIKGNREKRPDIVVYVNGIALAILELKRSTVSIGDGISVAIDRITFAKANIYRLVIDRYSRIVHHRKD